MAKQRRYVPQSFDPGEWSQVEPMGQQLLNRSLSSQAQLLEWLEDFSEFAAVTDEYGSRRHIDRTCHTDDPRIEKVFLHYIEEIEPRLKPVEFALKRKFIQCPHRSALDGPRYAMLSRNWSAEVELFRDENVPLQTRESKLINEYDKLCGAMTVEFDGQTRTMPQMAKFLEEPDRSTRERAWFAASDRRLQDQQAVEALFEDLLPLRHQMAMNAGLSDYRAYCWKHYKRFDYTPDDCLRFADAVAECVVPLRRQLARERVADLRLDSLRPWDHSVDPKGRPPLRPFDSENIPQFLAVATRIFQRLSPALSEQFDSLRENGNLDLGSRAGKAPGGYQSFLAESLQPFIFMNAAGTHRDVITLLHEGGHAFHSLASKDEPLHFLRHAPMEFCEVASMGMELLAGEHLDLFYPDASELARARRQHLEGIVGVLAWIATIDGFQHWLYTHPEHTREQRCKAWLEIFARFDPDTDFSGLEKYRESSWQRQLHLFHCPFYYIEYGIAQLGALQLWLKSRQDPRQALSHYRAGLKLGGTRTLPQLFAAMGLQFDFSRKTIAPLMSALRDELSELPA